MALVDSYSESNQSNSTLYGGGQDFVAQSFTGNGEVLDYAQFYLKVQGSPDGNMYAHIYAHTGTFGTSSKPTGSSLAVSGAIAASTLTTSFQLITFTFTGADKITLTNATNYCVVLETNNTQAAPNYIVVGGDSTSPTHGGNYAYTNDGGATWSAGSDDLCFYVYADDSATTTSTTTTSTSTTSTSTSTTTTSTSTTSTSSSTTTLPNVSNDYGVKIAKQGHSVYEEDNHLIYNSAYPLLKIAGHGTGTLTLSSGNGSKTIFTHNLGYKPMFYVWVTYIDPNTGSEVAKRRLCSWTYYTGLGQRDYYIATATTSLITLNISTNATFVIVGGTGSDTLEYHYVVYYDPIKL